jgi:malate/lactate dehydrogenase
MGVPVRLGAAGIEEIVELSEAERSQLVASADAVRQVVDVLNLEVSLGA